MKRRKFIKAGALFVPAYLAGLSGIIRAGSAPSLNVAGTARVGTVSRPAGGAGNDITDNFDRADSGDIGANWTVTTSESAFSISGNKAAASGGADCSERYSGVTWSDNQSSEAKVTVNGIDPGSGFGVLVRCAAGARTYYRLVINSDGEWELEWKDAGSSTSLATGTTTYSAGAVIKLSAIGTTLTSIYNGSQVDSRTHASIASGSPGIAYSSIVTSGSVDDWRGIDGL